MAAYHGSQYLSMASAGAGGISSAGGVMAAAYGGVSRGGGGLQPALLEASRRNQRQRA
jgi:hypothetical protein